MKRGTFIVIEGTDGSGKGTQFKLLVERLRKDKRKVVTFDFPQYGTLSAYFVEQYLKGVYGGANDVGPYQASLFYALDRFDAAERIRAALEKGQIVLANRFTGSNMGHQGSKFKTSRERATYFKWLDDLEFGILGIPRPNLNIVLHVPAAIAQKLVDKKHSSLRAYVGGKKRDIHEKSLSHLKKSEAVYLEMTKLFPKNFQLIECFSKNRLLSIPEVEKKIWQLVKKHV